MLRESRSVVAHGWDGGRKRCREGSEGGSSRKPLGIVNCSKHCMIYMKVIKRVDPRSSHSKEKLFSFFIVSI